MTPMPPLPQDFGHLHPAVVHFPIACFVCALLFEWIALARRREGFAPGVPLLLLIGVLGGVLSMFSGWNLEEFVKGGFGEEGMATLERHELSGIVSTSVGFAALLAGLFYRRAPILWKRIVYLVLLHVSAAGVAFAGALGGSLVWE
jgi:uncharacterized membrane protein